jgi:cell division septal protein FtsQ
MRWFKSRKTKAPKPVKRRGSRFPKRAGMFFGQLLICTGVLAVFLYWFALYVEHSGLFNVKVIQVDGADFLRDEDIIAQSGVTSGDCIFLLRPEIIRKNILAMPFVSWCHVNRVFPDRLEIEIKERIALATLLVNNRLFELDAVWNVLRELEAEEKHVGPLITAQAELGYVEVGQQMPQESLKQAVDVWRAFARTSMANDVTVSEICAEDSNKISMTCDELPCEIRWAKKDFEAQAWELDVIWRSEKGRMPFREYIDLRFGNDYVACR